MAHQVKPGVNKLMRVLVAGGVALSGAAGLARADDQPAEKKMEKSESMEKEHMGKDDHAKHHEKHAKKEKKAEEKKDEKAASDGGGVKGW